MFGTHGMFRASVWFCYLSLDPVGEVFPDSPERLSQFQDVVVGILAGGDLSNVNHLTGAALNHKHRVSNRPTD